MKPIADGVTVVTSRYWQTNTGMIATDAGVVLVDAGVFPDEMRSLAKAVEAPIIAGITTHEHWDHMLWSKELGSSVPRYASPDAARVAEAERTMLLGRVAREEKAPGEEWDTELFGRLIAHEVGVFDPVASCIQLIALPGHTAGQIGVWVDDADVFFVGDTASDIDPPALPDDAVGAVRYLETLRRTIKLVADARVVVPGHGTPCGAPDASARLALDRVYLDDDRDVERRRLIGRCRRLEPTDRRDARGPPSSECHRLASPRRERHVTPQRWSC
jgi:glyoxylase-like metal-dependent hydrolase (beta-lactamase superfamily II)